MAQIYLYIFMKWKKYFSARINYIDYKALPRDLYKIHNDDEYNLNNYYKNNSRYIHKPTKSFPAHYYDSSREIFNILYLLFEFFM